MLYFDIYIHIITQRKWVCFGVLLSIFTASRSIWLLDFGSFTFYETTVCDVMNVRISFVYIHTYIRNNPLIMFIYLIRTFYIVFFHAISFYIQSFWKDVWIFQTRITGVNNVCNWRSRGCFELLRHHRFLKEEVEEKKLQINFSVFKLLFRLVTFLFNFWVITFTSGKKLLILLESNFNLVIEYITKKL